MPAQLVALSEGPSYLLDKPILLLGRHPECDIQIDSRKVSRRHCCIAQVNDYLVVRDLGSTNGIRINGARLLEGRLKPGDEVTIGSLRYQIRWEGPQAPSIVERPSARDMRQVVLQPSAIADEDLESCDEPVPLGEPSALGRASLPVPPLHPAPHQRSSSPILPDQLELAPSSDGFPIRPTQPPSAH